MSKGRIVVVGVGGHATSCIDVIEQQNLYEIFGLIGMPEEINSKKYGYPVIGTDLDLDEVRVGCENAAIGVGQIKSPATRMKIYERLCSLGYLLPVIISPRAYVSPRSSIGAGTIVCHGAVVNAGVSIGENCIINSGALIEHDSVIGDHCHISTATILNGNVKVGDGTFVGSGCVVKQGVELGANCVIGMNLSVRKNQENFSRKIGN